jgi:hypothetical protein
MATQAHVRKIALALPEVHDGGDRFALSVTNKGKEKGFAWVWMERVNPKQPKVANAGVLAIRVANVAQRDLMIVVEPEKYFTEPHYNGSPAVLVRLPAVRVAELRPLLYEAWRLLAPKELVRRHEEKGG